MKLFAIIALSLAYCLIAGAEEYAVRRYELTIRILPADQRLEAAARMTVENRSGHPLNELRFVLYRLLDVSGAEDSSGRRLQFTQTITSFADEPTLQVNAVRIELPVPLAPSTSIVVSLRYAGSVFGYTEVMQYVHDRVGEEYTLLRSDAFAYPVAGSPSWKSIAESYDVRFTYTLDVTAPSALTVVAGGAPVLRHTAGDTTTSTFASAVPTTRIDIAAARFLTYRDSASRLTVYALPEDSLSASRILASMRRAIGYYSGTFGTLRDSRGYTAVEIPDGWGSQAGNFYFLQTAAAFKDSTKIGEVYHEIAHAWNAKVKPSVQRCRWFDEAFAMYFEALAVRQFQGDQDYRRLMDDLRRRWVGRSPATSKNFTTPIAKYGEEELGQNSYTKGAWSLYVLHSLAGDEPFRALMRAFIADHAVTPADFADFRRAAEKSLGRSLSRFFEEWIDGVESSQLLTGTLTIDEIAQRYRR